MTEVSDYIQYDPILDGRVKTLHPKIHGGILGCRNLQAHVDAMTQMEIDPIDVVVVNLYPFFEKSGEQLPEHELVEFIDIGGPTMIRAAAKNYASVIVVTETKDYELLMKNWPSGDNKEDQKKRCHLAAKAFALTGAYDSAIASYFLNSNTAPSMLTYSFKKSSELRYGENPHQKAAWYVPNSPANFGALSDFEIHQGKELSFNNLRDLDAAWRVVNEFETPACVGIKHTTPCGVALGQTPLDAWKKAHSADPVSIFGGVVAFNRKLDEETALSLSQLFLEVIVAPAYSEEALNIFSRKKNLRVVRLFRSSSDQWEALPVDGGVCLQTVDKKFVPKESWMIPTQHKPTQEQMLDLAFAWRVVKHVKSNGIVLASHGATVGIGSGQANRVGAVETAIAYATTRSNDSVLASDAFFPFDDAVKMAARAGIKAIIQPGGSVRDRDSIVACDEEGIAMVFTGCRHFRH